MEIRKVQLVGHSSFSVTLPPDWIKENRIKPSDSVTITREEDGSLNLVPGLIREEKKELNTRIDADLYKDHGLLARLISSSYINGFDLIEVVSKHTISDNHRKEIDDAVNNIMGLGVIESTSNRVVLQSMIDPTKFPLKPLLKRLCKLAFSMYEDAIRALKDKDSSLSASVIQRENEFTKIFALLERQIAASAFDKTILKKIGLMGAPDIALHTLMLPRIRMMAGNVLDIAKNQMALGKNALNDVDLQKIIRMGEITHEIFSNAVEAFFNNDVVLANRMMESAPHLEETEVELITNFCSRIKDLDVGKNLIYIVKDMSRIAVQGNSIAEIAIIGSIFHNR